MSQIAVGKPDLRTADKRAIALGKYLRHNKTVKSRECILNGERMEFFRLKRAARALLEPAYDNHRKRVPVLPEIKTEQEAYEVLKLFPLNRVAFNVQKLETEVALALGLKPLSGIPCVKIAPQQQTGPEEYYAWFYDPVPLSSVLYTVGAFAAVLTLIAFPLWPYQLRKLVWYASMAALGFLAFIFATSIVRLVVFAITFFLVKPGIWIFPNLFADLGVLESFMPVWGWQGIDYLPQKPKKKKRVKTEAERRAIKAQADKIRAAQGTAGGAAAAPAAAPAGQPIPGMPANAPPMLQQIMQRAMQQTLMRVEQRKQEIMQQSEPMSAEEQKALHEKLFAEEAKKTQAELQQISQKMEALKAAQAARAGAQAN